MTFSLFTRIVGQLSEFSPRVARLHLYKDGEPLLNRDLGRMIRAAVDRGVATSVETTTNAILMTPGRALELVDSGLDWIRISVQPANTGSPQDQRSQQLYRRCLQNTQVLRELIDSRGSNLKIHAKVVKFAEVDEIVERFEADFAPLADTIHIDSPMGWDSTSDFDFALGAKPSTGMTGESLLSAEREVCPYPFYSLAVNYDGSVSACCVDWSKALVVGNVSDSRLARIWRGAELAAIRVAHLDGLRSTLVPCAGCQFMQGCSTQSDLDSDAERLRAVYGTEE